MTIPKSTEHQGVQRERRHSSPDKQALWARLSISQRLSATNLSHFGYELMFIRHTNDGGLAIFLCGQSIATINVDGDIDSAPEIQIR